MYCQWYGKVSPTGNRGLTAGQRWLRLRVWMSLKQNSTLLSSCPLLRDMFMVFSYNGRGPLYSRFTSLRYVCSPPRWFLLCLTIYHCLYLILHSPLSVSLSLSLPSYSPPDKVLWGLDCWLSPNLLYNRTVSFPESLLGQASLSLATYLASISLFNAQQQSFCLLGFTALMHF